MHIPPTILSRTLGAIEIPTDTQDVNFGPYVQKVREQVKTNWYRLIPESATPPLKKEGKLAIEFAIRFLEACQYALQNVFVRKTMRLASRDLHSPTAGQAILG